MHSHAGSFWDGMARSCARVTLCSDNAPTAALGRDLKSGHRLGQHLRQHGFRPSTPRSRSFRTECASGDREERKIRREDGSDGCCVKAADVGSGIGRRGVFIGHLKRPRSAPSASRCGAINVGVALATRRNEIAAAPRPPVIGSGGRVDTATANGACGRSAP